MPTLNKLKTDAEYLFQEPCSQALIKWRAEILGELMLKKRLGVEIIELKEEES